MYCPNCRFPNRATVKQCEHCEADLGDLRERVAIGNQFVFADASDRRPVALSLEGLQPNVFYGPTVLSRHQHDIGLGEDYIRPGYLTNPALRPRPGVDLPRLPPPARPNLTAIVTERKIYRPKDEAHIFIVAPDAPNQEVEMEVQLSSQQLTKDRVTLDEAGLALTTFADLEEGEYTLLVYRLQDGVRLAGGKPAQCSFSVAEFTLSPLVALLQGHTYESGELSLDLRVLALSIAYNGPAELGLHCAGADRVVETAKANVKGGLVKTTFDVRKHEGPFRVLVTTPDGQTASVFVPGTGKTEREKITLCALGRVAEASLLPAEESEEVRGLHVDYTSMEVTPIQLESAVARTGCLVSEVRAEAMKVVTFDPLTGAEEARDFRGVQVGDKLQFPVKPPYTLFTAGILAPRQPYEAWGVVVYPQDLTASIQAPEHARPGEEIAVRLESDEPTACLLLVYDARLEHESPVPKLGRQIIEAVRSATADLKEQTAPSLASRPVQSWDPDWDTMAMGGMARSAPRAVGRLAEGRRPRPVMMGSETNMAVFLQSAAAPGGMLGATGEPAVDLAEVSLLSAVACPSREDFPEMAYMELLTVDGVAERTVPLGDQIGTWRCRAYFVAGLDIVERTVDVEAAKAAYAELDLPAIVGQGDDILASVHYHTQQPASLSISLPDGRSISGIVAGHGTEALRLTEPGEVTVHLSSPDGDDWTTRAVKAPGVQSVTVSRLDILKRGETVAAERVVVYPGPADVLTETIAALGRYPFG